MITEIKVIYKGEEKGFREKLEGALQSLGFFDICTFRDGVDEKYIVLSSSRVEKQETIRVV